MVDGSARRGHRQGLQTATSAESDVPQYGAVLVPDRHISTPALRHRDRPLQVVVVVPQVDPHRRAVRQRGGSRYGNCPCRAGRLLTDPRRHRKIPDVEISRDPTADCSPSCKIHAARATDGGGSSRPASSRSGDRHRRRGVITRARIGDHQACDLQLGRRHRCCLVG